jgi:riboflavin biosynthesis pyrimidine reductase
VDLHRLCDALRRSGVRSLMVEGGARVIASFLEARLVDHLMLTISPRWVGGLPALGDACAPAGVTLEDWRCRRLGDDLILGGTVAFGGAR